MVWFSGVPNNKRKPCSWVTEYSESQVGCLSQFSCLLLLVSLSSVLCMGIPLSLIRSYIPIFSWQLLLQLAAGSLVNADFCLDRSACIFSRIMSKSDAEFFWDSLLFLLRYLPLLQTPVEVSTQYCCDVKCMYSTLHSRIPIRECGFHSYDNTLE